MTTTYTTRNLINTSYESRTDWVFLMTQALDFLMTQDDNYIVLQNSYSDYNNYNIRPTVTTSYSLRPSI